MSTKDPLRLVPDEELELLNLDRTAIQEKELLRHKAGHLVCRLQSKGKWFVLKWFEEDDPLEPRVYSILQANGIPTLPVHGQTHRSLLLEDLAHSRKWRAARPSDMEKAGTGVALADWYHKLHQAGSLAMRRQATLPPTLRPWTESLSVETLEAAGKKLGLHENASWWRSYQSIDTLKEKAREFPLTFNYDDFDMENLALSRGRKAPLQAIVFDYDCFTLGTAYTDWRNVTYSLKGAAKEAFSEAYGPINKNEQLLDTPLATFFGLLTAAERKKLPEWARPLIESVHNGDLEQSVRVALLV